MSKFDPTDNHTGTELDILKDLEKSYYDHNPRSRMRHTQRSMKWFSQYVPRAYNRTRTARMYRDRSLWKQKITVGKMYFFQYDAKHKDILPVWDMYPMVFFFDTFRSKEGKEILQGINLHYLPPALRFAAMVALLKTRNEKRYRESTRLRISWEILKGLANSEYFKHAVKNYRVDHIRSTFVEIPAQSWELAVFLPLARWQKGTAQTAYNIKK